jgi:HEAT repeat protein
VGHLGCYVAPHMGRILVILSLVLTATLGFGSTASADAPSRDTVRAMLSSFEQGPSQIQWRALGAETVEVLIALYNDPNEPGFVRMRAVAATANFPIPATRVFLLQVSAAPGQGDLYIRQAVSSLGRAFGDRALEDVRPFLVHGDYVVREAAVRALGAMRAPIARQLLEARMSVENEDAVRSALIEVLAH